jgi:hypothetical protein
MANADMKVFLEDRLRALDSTIDLDPGSPAQVQFIEPVLARLGTDPLETDILAFLTDRFAQEFPDIYALDPSVVSDTFVKPLITFLEPFKREIQTLKNNQSLIDPTILSDEDAEALAANVFEERDSGGFAVGVVRSFFSNPTNINAEITTRFFTGSGLNYFPSNPTSITAEEMVFNRQGSLYFFDVAVRAEFEGADYNIPADEISGVDGIFGAVKVSNPREFKDGASKLDTPTFIATARESLTERSLVTRRGAAARIRQVFQTDLRAVQIIGAKDEEMQRDILVAASPGHAWLTGSVSLYQSLAFVQCSTVEGAESDAPVPGDTLYVYLSPYVFLGLQQGDRFVRLIVEEVLVGPQTTTNNPYQVAYLVRWSGTFPSGVVITYPTTFNGGFSKKGVVRISSLPDTGPVSFAVESGEAHVFGHSDIYARPILQPLSKAVLSGLYDSGSLIERTVLATNGGAGVNKNKVIDAGIDFAGVGVEPGDVMVLESTEDAGAYVVGKVLSGVGAGLYLTANMTKSRTNIRYRVIKNIKVDPFEPKILKFPFGTILANDLQTIIGSNLLKLSTNDLLAYSAKEGDIIRVLSGTDPKDYTITGFDSVLGGRGIICDLSAGSSEGGLSYQLFTALEVVERPLVRVKEVMLLDSAKQTTGITIPPSEPVAMVPTCDFTSARVRGGSQRASGYVLPNLVTTPLVTFISGGNVAAPAVGGTVVTSDRRYSLGFDTATGTYKPLFTNNGGTFDHFEFDYRADAFEGCNYFMSISEFEDETENFPPVDPKPGECLRIKTGPNKGSYLIKQVIKQKFKLYSPNRTAWVYFIQIYGYFPVDIFKELISFLNDIGGVGVAVSELPITAGVEFPTFFKNLYNSFGSKLHGAFLAESAASPGAVTLQAMVDSVAQVEYEWGDPARGVLRSYFTEPVLFQQNTGNSPLPTSYLFTTDNGEILKFRPDPERYTKHEIIPPRLTADTAPVDYPRDLDASAGGGVVEFEDVEKPSVFEAGVQVGDFLSVHEEIFFHGSKTKRSAVSTVANSTIIEIPPGLPQAFTSQMVGNLVFMEQGPDKGGYRVVKFIDSGHLALDKPLSVSTPPVVEEGTIGSWGYDGSNNKIISSTAVDFEDYLNMFITIFGMNYQYQGSYKIKVDVLTLGTTAIIERIGNFPGVVSEPAAFWVITAAPDSTPETELDGTILYGLQAARMYQNVPKELEVTAVQFDDPSTSELTVTTSPKDGLFQPYRIYRKDIRRVTPTELDENRDGPFCFFDTEVVSLDPNVSANIEHHDRYLTIEEGTYKSSGYKHLPDDPNLTYSIKETGSMEFPTRILPVGSEDSPDNFLNLSGAPVQISYEKAEVVRLLQEFLDSPEDRVTAANMLARHFLPAFVSYDATYSGGSAASLIAKDIIAYLDTIPVESPVDISEIEELITKRGGNPITPTKAMSGIHDWDRKMWLEFSENEVGGTVTKVPYNGTPRVSYVRPGPDVSGQEDIPAGERINLTRR